MTTAATQPTPLARQYQPAYTTPPNSQGHPQYNLLQQQRHYSPTASHPQTPVPNSPASPQTNAPGADFLPAVPGTRPPSAKPADGKPPYLPAALRPTDPPRSHPLTPPRSVHGSTDSLAQKGKPSRPVSRRSTTNPSSTKSFGSITDLLSHIPSEDIEPALSKTSDLPEPTGAPTRQHWKPDVNATICDYPVCQKNFGLLERRHHCRHCGNVFCKTHSTERLPLDQNAEFHPKGGLVRACEHCAKLFVEWVEERVERCKSGMAQGEQTTPKRSSPMALTGVRSNQSQPEVHRGTVVAGSVGGDWSTF